MPRPCRSVRFWRDRQQVDGRDTCCRPRLEREHMAKITSPVKLVVGTAVGAAGAVAPYRAFSKSPAQTEAEATYPPPRNVQAGD